MGKYGKHDFGHTDCVVCGMRFKKSSSSHKFCSDECSPHKNLAKRAFNVLERDDFRCVYCGKSSIEDGVKLSLDHIQPSSKGGKDDVSNLVTSCQICNSSKGGRQLCKSTRDRLLRLVEIRNQQSCLDPRLFIKDIDPGVDDAD